ncbi:MAG: hypothetical protein ACM37W_27915 [Actinomycetota bacterium]
MANGGHPNREGNSHRWHGRVKSVCLGAIALVSSGLPKCDRCLGGSDGGFI